MSDPPAERDPVREMPCGGEWTWNGVVVFVAVVLAVFAYCVAYRNFKECRQAGFSRVYCASTHLVR